MLKCLPAPHVNNLQDDEMGEPTHLMDGDRAFMCSLDTAHNQQ